MYSLIQCSTVQCSAVCLCLASITAGAGAPLWYILRLTHIQPTTCQLIHVFFYLYYVNTDIRVCVYVEIRVYNEYNLHLAKSYIYSFSATHQHQYHYLSPLIGHVTSWSEPLCLWVSTSAKKAMNKALNEAEDTKLSLFIMWIWKSYWILSLAPIK